MRIKGIRNKGSFVNCTHYFNKISFQAHNEHLHVNEYSTDTITGLELKIPGRKS